MRNWWRFWKQPSCRAEALTQGLILGCVLSVPAIGLPFIAVSALFPAKQTFAQQCAKRHEEGSSAWVRCVDRLVEEKEKAKKEARA